MFKLIENQLRRDGFIGLPFSYSKDGVVFSDAITKAQRLAIQDIFDTYDPVAGSLLENKEQKKNEIRAAFNNAATQPVAIAGTAYNGGIDSVLRLDGAKRLAELSGLTTVTFYDIDNAAQVLPIIDDANSVVIAILTAYRLLHDKKQSLMRDIDAATDEKAVNLVTW